MSRENAARRLSRFKADNGDDDDDGIFVQSPFVSVRASSFARDTPLFADHPLSILSLADQLPD